jgi:acyl-CoA reductase-like NAD-dependent aldehyde dehydrogenase
MSDRLAIRKTYKLVISGASSRSESGRSYEVTSSSGQFLANAALASKKDVKAAVVAARSAQPKWWDSSAYNKGQVIYRLGEMLDGRADELAQHVILAEALTKKEALTVVDRTIARVLWYAGWTDKLAQVIGSTNPVAGPYFNFSSPRPCGVIAVIASQDSSLLSFVDSVLAPICVGNTVVVVASEARPLPAVLVGEATMISDFPPGVLNILTGSTSELAPVLAAHEDVDGLYLVGVDENEGNALAALAAQSIKRVVREDPGSDRLKPLRAFTETTTVWHTVGQ